ncbi:MAG: NAD(P)H-quinone oxidoreductase [Acidobacteriota bacterium]
MRAIVFDQPGDERVLRVAEIPAPSLGPGEVRIAVAACAVNRADLLQRQGKYPPPPGASEILGLECSGEVTEVASDVRDWTPGDRVAALLAGGGYAEEVVAPAGCLMRVPESLSLLEAAAIPEVYLTVHLTVFMLAALPNGGSALVHGGGSGIGTAAIQLVKAVGGHVIVTAGSEGKCRRCEAIGADRAVNYRTGDFLAAARELTGGTGVDVVLDSIGAPYLTRNLDALAVGGRLVVIATMGGRSADIDLSLLLRRRLSVIGSSLRSRPLAEKSEAVASFTRRFGPDLASGRVRPIVDRVLPLAQAGDAHRVMAASSHFGKIVLQVR